MLPFYDHVLLKRPVSFVCQDLTRLSVFQVLPKLTTECESSAIQLGEISTINVRLYQYKDGRRLPLLPHQSTCNNHLKEKEKDLHGLITTKQL